MIETENKKAKRLKDPLFWLTALACANALGVIVYFLSIREKFDFQHYTGMTDGLILGNGKNDRYDVPIAISVISLVSAIHYIICLAKWRAWAAAMWTPNWRNLFVIVDLLLLLAWLGLAAVQPGSLIFSLVPVVCNISVISIVLFRSCGLCVCGRPIQRERKARKSQDVESGIEDVEAGVGERVEQFGWPYEFETQMRSEAAWMSSSVGSNQNTLRGGDMHMFHSASPNLTRTPPSTPINGLERALLDLQDDELEPPQNSIEASFRRLSARLSSNSQLSVSLPYGSQTSLPLPPTPANSLATENSFISHSASSSRSGHMRLPQEEFYPHRPLSQIHPALRAASAEVPTSPNPAFERRSSHRPTTADSATLPSRFPSSSGRRTIASLSGLCNMIPPSSSNDDEICVPPPAHHRATSSFGTDSSFSVSLPRSSNPPTSPLPEIPNVKAKSKVKKMFKLPPSPLRGKVEGPLPLSFPEPPRSAAYEQRGGLRGWYEPEIYVQTTRFG
ncbi:hypothetical protein RUND412_003390 [Rhizina undulata]